MERPVTVTDKFKPSLAILIYHISFVLMKETSCQHHQNKLLSYCDI